MNFAAFSQLLAQHPAMVALVGYYIFSAAISAMPSPDAASSKSYRWLFNFAHALAGNLLRVSAIRNLLGNGNGNGSNL